MKTAILFILIFLVLSILIYFFGIAIFSSFNPFTWSLFNSLIGKISFGLSVFLIFLFSIDILVLIH